MDIVQKEATLYVLYMTNKADDGTNLSLTCKVTYLATILSSLH